MSLVADYGSTDESDEEKPVVAPVQWSQPAVPAPVVVSGVTVSGVGHTKKSKTKKKKRKASKKSLVLPPEIQAALERMVDSDSDDNEVETLKRRKLKASADAAKLEGNLVDSNSLLDSLPKPKFSDPVDPFAVASSSTSDGATSNSVSVTASSSSTHTSSQYSSAPPIVSYPPAPATDYGPSGVDMQEEEVSSGKMTRRQRERMLERQLVNGNLSVVENTAQELNRVDPTQWSRPIDPLGSASGDSEPIQVKASFWNSSAGEATVSIKPSRQHRQRHQINQLAFDAKAREFELMERRGNSFKTKRETQARYGW